MSWLYYLCSFLTGHIGLRTGASGVECHYGEPVMLLWVRAVAVLGTSLLLMGSKLIIHVPQGGAVVSSSGLFACDAGESCTIDINEHHFAETFTAVPAAGYAFNHWQNGTAAICGGSNSMQCDELGADPFGGFDTSATTQRNGGVLKLSPAFTGSAYRDNEPAPEFAVSSYQSTRYYAVHGSTRNEIWAQLTGSANPLPVDRNAGLKPLGHASFKYKYDYQSEYAGNSSSCRVQSGNFDFRFETVLPRLAVNDSVRNELDARWSSLQDRVTEHEAGHHAIYRQLVTRLPEALQRIGIAPCSELEHRVSQAVTQAVDEIRRASAEYDEYHSDESYAISSL
jgi:predicted secreted Zn-dependent protease